jgi:hypothetical protein
MQERPIVPVSQRIFGELVYWITVLCAILCIVGPLITFIDMDNNVLNPHTLFGNIFDGMPTEAGGIDLEEDVMAGDTVLKLDDVGDFEVDQTINITADDEVVESDLVIASIDEDANTITLTTGLQNAYSTENDIQVAEETIWDSADGNVKGGHYWLDHFTKGDGFTLFGMVLGCAVGIIAMIITGLYLLLKEKSVGWALGSFFIAFMSAISMIGLISVE